MVRKLFPMRYNNVMKQFNPDYKDTVYYLCPRYGQAMREENIPENRKCPNTQRRYGSMGCKEGCYYVPYDEKYESLEQDRKKKSVKPKPKRKISKKKKGCGCK